VRNVTVHIEAVRNPVALAGELRAAGAMAGLAIKPRTPLEPYLTLLGHYDTLLIMSVEPGSGGQTFIREVLNKVRTARRLIDTGHLRLLIEIDGGINVETIRAAAQAGADWFRGRLSRLRHRRSGPSRASAAPPSDTRVGQLLTGIRATRKRPPPQWRNLATTSQSHH
jgi:hypothetical protein